MLTLRTIAFVTQRAVLKRGCKASCFWGSKLRLCPRMNSPVSFGFVRLGAYVGFTPSGGLGLAGGMTNSLAEP